MFWRKSEGLPMTGSQHGPDGSGRKIHMDAPLWRAWKNADGYIKGSYICLVVSILLMISGYRALRYHNASIWLSCTAEECTLEITAKGRRGTIEVDFARKQLLSAQSIKVDLEGNFVKIADSDPYGSTYRDPRKKKGKKKYRAGFEKGPDKEGNYDSYHLILQPLTPAQEEKQKRRVSGDNPKEEGEEEDDDDVLISDFEKIKDYTRVDENGQLVLQMRRFNLGETRRRTRIMVNKVDAYVKKRRHKLVIKENAGLSFRGIFSMVLGLFILCLTVLLGQFMEEPKPRQGGPGARRQLARRTATPQARSNLTYRKAAASGAAARKRY